MTWENIEDVTKRVLERMTKGDPMTAPDRPAPRCFPPWHAAVGPDGICTECADRPAPESPECGCLKTLDFKDCLYPSTLARLKAFEDAQGRKIVYEKHERSPAYAELLARLKVSQDNAAESIRIRLKQISELEARLTQAHLEIKRLTGLAVEHEVEHGERLARLKEAEAALREAEERRDQAKHDYGEMFVDRGIKIADLTEDNARLREALEKAKPAETLLRLILEEDWWMLDEGDFAELMLKAGIVEDVECTREMVEDESVRDAEEGDRVYVLKPEFRAVLASDAGKG